VEPSKSPGSPLCHIAQYNRDILEKRKAELYQVVNARIHQYIDLGRKIFQSENVLASLYASDAECVCIAKRLVLDGLTDVVLTEFKGEPRLVGKNPRLVANVSVITNTVKRIVLGNHLVEEQNHKDIPTAVALDLVTPEKLRERFDHFKSNARGKNLQSDDTKRWEYSMTRQMRYTSACKKVWCMGLADSEMKPYPGKEDHFYAVWADAYVSSHRVLQFNNGELYIPPPGQMSSGEFDTFSTNSDCRSELSNSVCLALTGEPIDYTESGGDDNMSSEIQREKAEVIEEYKRRGFTLTDIMIQNVASGFNFCSTKFLEERSYGENIRRVAYAHMMSPPEMKAEYDIGFKQLYSHHPDFERYWALTRNHLQTGGTVLRVHSPK
jgi:hypothetical protein